MDMDGSNEGGGDGTCALIITEDVFPLAADASLLGAILDESECGDTTPMDEGEGHTAVELPSRGSLLYQRFNGDIDRALLRTDDLCYARVLAVLLAAIDTGSEQALAVFEGLVSHMLSSNGAVTSGKVDTRSFLRAVIQHITSFQGWFDCRVSAPAPTVSGLSSAAEPAATGMHAATTTSARSRQLLHVAAAPTFTMSR